MKIKVLLFAQARQIAGNDQLEVDIESGATVGDLRESISDSFPELSQLLARSGIALDQEYAVDGDIVTSDAEVAMIPPVSGG